jgi:hypothetical protein
MSDKPTRGRCRFYGIPSVTSNAHGNQEVPLPIAQRLFRPESHHPWGFCIFLWVRHVFMAKPGNAHQLPRLRAEVGSRATYDVGFRERSRLQYHSSQASLVSMIFRGRDLRTADVSLPTLAGCEGDLYAGCGRQDAAAGRSFNVFRCADFKTTQVRARPRQLTESTSCPGSDGQHLRVELGAALRSSPPSNASVQAARRLEAMSGFKTGPRPSSRASGKVSDGRSAASRLARV